MWLTDDSALMRSVLDWIVSLFILFFIFGSRFNSWPKKTGQKSPFGGKPIDYIAKSRFYSFCFLYLATYAVLALVLKNFPQLLVLIPESVREPLGMGAIGEDTEKTTLGALLDFYFPYVLIWAVAVSSWSLIKEHDNRWREILHDWARIPREVEELMLAVTTYNSFFPTPGFKAQLEANLVTDNGVELKGQTLHQYWLSQYDELAQLRANSSVSWFYLKCVSLLVLTRSTCFDLRLRDINAKENRLKELGAILPFKSVDAAEIQAYVAELETMSTYFIECLCKHMVRKYSNREDQCSALKNMGFEVSRADFVDPKIKEAVVWSLAAVFVISCAYVAGLLYVLDEVRPDQYFTAQRFMQWQGASFVSFSLAILVGFFIKAIPKDQTYSNAMLYFAALLISTLGAFVYFRIAQDLGQSSVEKPWARVTLSVSFASLSLFVLSALQRLSHDLREVIQFSMIQGVILGLIMMVLQIAISLSFRWDAYLAMSVVEWFSQSDGYLLKVGFVGFWKGFFLATVVTFAIQEVYRRQLLATLRKNPRAESNLLLSLKLNNRELIASTKNISKYGLKLSCRQRLAPDQVIRLNSRVLGDFDAVVRWTKRSWLGSYNAGLEVLDDIPKLQTYLRSQFGEFYA